MNSIYFARFIRFLFTILLIISGVISVYYVSKVAYPFIIALLISFFMNPLVNGLQKKARLPRSLAVFLSILLIFLFIMGILTLLVAEIISGTNYLANNLPGHIHILLNYIKQFVVGTILPIYNEMTTLFHHLDSSQQNTVLDQIENLTQSISEASSEFIQVILRNIPAIVSWIPNTMSALVFTLMATFFISKDWYRIKKTLKRVLPKKLFFSMTRVFLDLKGAFFGFIKAQFTLVSFTTITILIGFLILKVKYSITIALICGLVDLIPYLGTGIIFVPWIFYEAITGNTNLALGLTVLYIIVIVQRQLIEPKVLSSSIGIDPLMTLIALFVGFKILGFIGLIIGPVLLVIINTLQRTNIFGEIWRFILGTKKE